MNKKGLVNKEKEYAAYALSVYLANECYQRDNQGKQATDRRYDGTIKQHTLASVLAEKASIVEYRLSAVGYLKAVSMLFKATFLQKKPHGAFPIFRCAFFVQ